MSGGKLVLVILAIIGVLFVLGIAACGGLLWWGYSTVKESADPEVDAMFAAIDSGTFADSYNTKTTADFRRTMTQEEYAAMGEAIKENLGSLQSKTKTSFKVNSDAAIDVTYSAQFEKGTAEIVVRLTSTDMVNWKFDSFAVRSDQLPDEALLEIEEAPPVELPAEVE